MNFHRRGLDVGPLTFHWYGLLIVTGILAAAWLVAWMAQRDKDKDPERVWDALIWIILLAVIGARLWSAAFPSISSVEAGRTAEWYFTHPFDLHDGIFVIWSGGMSVFGGVLGGALGVVLYAWRHKLDIISWLDLAAIALPLGQAVGRWGNYVNEELYGEPTDLPWGITVSHPPPGYASDTHFHPLFLYESLLNLTACGVMLLLWLRYRDRFRKGDFVLLYLIAYGTLRYFLEFLRIEVAMSGGINVSQTVSGLAALVGVGLLVLRRLVTRGRTDEKAESSQEAV